MTTLMQVYVFVLAGFVGFLVIARVPPLLHTPLMSATNAISGISLVGSIVAAGAGRGVVSTVLGTVAVTAATINVVGGFNHHQTHAGDVQAQRSPSERSPEGLTSPHA
jgi:NAD(P) transhydrogenase subunit alpha